MYSKLGLTICYRERDTMAQRIGQIDEVIEVIQQLSNASITWAQACERLPEAPEKQDV